MKCRGCVWADWRSGTKVFCPFSACIKKEPEQESEKVTDDKVDLEVRRDGEGKI